ncbi:MAG: HIT family protein [Fimbriiglobus sp.]
MDQLWAPWRLAYITQPVKPRPTSEGSCFLCEAATAESDRDRELLVVCRTSHSIVILNRFPYNNGHLLICPLRHVADLPDLTAEEVLDQHQLLVKYESIIRRTMNADGFNVGLNLGRSAGAGVPGHLHWHLVPRWDGDTNFMPIFTDVKVIVQSLDSLWELLRRES